MKARVKELATLAFVAEASNLLMLGPPGVGKTHLAVALALRSILTAPPAVVKTPRKRCKLGLTKGVKMLNPIYTPLTPVTRHKQPVVAL